MADTSRSRPGIPPGISPEDFELVRAAAVARNKLAPGVGDVAPEFELAMLSPGSERVKLSVLR